MSHRFQIVLTDQATQQLRDLAAFHDRPPSTLAASLVDQTLQQAAHSSAGSAAHPVSCPAEQQQVAPAELAPWIEPHDGDPAWRNEMWERIVALHHRYPRQLAHLKHGWWDEHSHTETLSALALWRAQLDQHGTDPREELAFQGQIADYAQLLRSEGGGVSKAWKPGPPPAAWSTR